MRKQNASETAAPKNGAPVHENHRARMQARVERDGLDSLAEHEALEYLLFFAIPRQDTNPLAHRLIQHFGGFCNVMEASETELLQVTGVGPKSARLIHAVMMFGRYYAFRARRVREAILQPEKAAEYVRPLFIGCKDERLYLILMDDQGRPLNDLCLGVGMPNRVTVDTCRMLREVARTAATRAVLTHNHPKGIAVPSVQDNLTTQYIRGSLAHIGVELVDHIIIAEGDYFSYAQRGRMPAGQADDGLWDPACHSKIEAYL